MKNISSLISLLFVLLANMCLAQSQISYDFNNNDLTSWTGTASHFIVNPGYQLQLNNTVGGTSYLATTFAPQQGVLEWNVYAKQSFAGSGNNYGRVYLMSNQENLTQSLNGYFLQLGEAGNNDAVELFRQSGNTVVSVCRGANATIASSFAIRIKVMRDESALWRVSVDYSGGTDFTEIASGTDATYTAGGYMGVVCVYTAGNAARFYYDDIYAGPPKPDPVPGDVARRNDIVINEFFPDPTPPVGLPEQEFVEIYNRSNKTFDLRGWKIGDAASFAAMPAVVLHPDEYLVVTSSDGLPSLNNGGDVVKIIDNRNVTIDSISYDLTWYQDQTKSGGGYTIERLNPEVASGDVTNWYVSQSVTGGTPGARNSVFGRNPDSKPPLIIEMIYLVDSVVVKFNERVVGGDLNNFRTVYRSDATVVIYLENLVNGLSYTINLTNITDLAGNPLAPKDFRFTYFIRNTINPKDVIITEIMADPAPVVQLPEAEYIEIYNRSDNPVDLTGWRLSDPTTIASLPSRILMPKEYLLLTSTTNASKFQKAVGVPSFPSLGNSGDRVMLRAQNSMMIDSVAYNLSWYRSSEKSDGGWSLELIDINNPCGEGDNWTASEDIDGGTPGEINSVFANKPDVTPPFIVAVTAVDANTLSIVFNEKLGSAGKISMEGTAKRGHHEVTYFLSKPLETRTLYQALVEEVTDCNGNMMLPVTVSFALPEEAKRGDVVINEVLFNPRPTGADFVEIYNRSDKYVNLKNWRFSDKIVTDQNLVLSPGSYRAFTSSIVATQSNYPLATALIEMSLPSFPDAEGRIDFINNKGDTIDFFYYRDDMHSPILLNTEGVSLERISPEENNWHSAAPSAGYATPGYENSMARPVSNGNEGSVSIQPEVINPSSVASFSQIRYRFDQGGLVANVSVVDLEGRVIKSIAVNETLGTEGSFQWDGDRAEGGLAGTGYYMVWFEVFGLDGSVNTYRRRIVVGF